MVPYDERIRFLVNERRAAMQAERHQDGLVSRARADAEPETGSWRSDLCGLALRLIGLAATALIGLAAATRRRAGTQR